MFSAHKVDRARREMIALDLRKALCELQTGAQGGASYRGLLPMVVRRFGVKLPEHEQALFQAWEQEFIDYLLDDVLEGVAKPLSLIELCLAFPNATLSEMVGLFPWGDGLKRAYQWKEDWIVDHLRSLLAAGVSLPAPIVSVLGTQGVPKHDYNELAYAVAPERLKLSWGDFKRHQGVWAHVVAIADDESDVGVAAEGTEYGIVPMAELVLNETSAQGLELEIDLQSLGHHLSWVLTAKPEEMNAARPGDGYRPVAWHNVFWELISEYARLRLSLEVRDPSFETDRELADHIKANYPEVKSSSRLAILRRRQNLSAVCSKLIEEWFWEKFSGAREQTGSRITHVTEEANP